MIEVAVYDTKPYDRKSLEHAEGANRIRWRFHEFRLNAETAVTAAGCQAVCVFVNDHADRSCVEKLSSLGARLLALRCAGFNNVDQQAAKELKLAVTRVPAYSPYAVAEHAVALLLALNRKIPRANNRVHDLNFSLQGLVGFGFRLRFLRIELHLREDDFLVEHVGLQLGLRGLQFRDRPFPCRLRFLRAGQELWIGELHEKLSGLHHRSRLDVRLRHAAGSSGGQLFDAPGQQLTVGADFDLHRAPLHGLRRSRATGDVELTPRVRATPARLLGCQESERLFFEYAAPHASSNNRARASSLAAADADTAAHAARLSNGSRSRRNE